ncbi:hypothetical protein LTR66_010651 [Elasticomyces elasticus]|nr:hypothetical protein LTR66_010651 [Elasticomyces elasticus]
MPHSVDADFKLPFEQQSRSSRRSSAFPKPAGTEIVGAALSLPNKNEDTLSHLHSDFSFEDLSKPPSPVAEAYNDLVGRSTITTDTTTHGAGGDKQEMNGNYHAEHDSMRRTAYYDEQFAYKDGGSGTARERVQKDSPVIAELRTNVIVRRRPFVLLRRLSRSRTNTPSSPISPTTSPHASPDPSPRS